MEVIIDRLWPKSSYTMGRVYIDGEKFCNSLEPYDRGLRQDMSVGDIQRIKRVGATAIPKGKYKIAFTYSARFRRQMPQVMNVKGFAGIRVHSGNKVEDTQGCPLFGDNTAKGWLSNSQKTCSRFEELLTAAGGTCDLIIR